MTEPGYTVHFPPVRGCDELIITDHIPQGDYAGVKIHPYLTSPFKCPDCGSDKVVFRGEYEGRFVSTCCNFRCRSIFSVISRK